MNIRFFLLIYLALVASLFFGYPGKAFLDDPILPIENQVK